MAPPASAGGHGVRSASRTASRIPAIARDRRFLALWAAHSTSTSGDALTTLTLVLLVTERTHSVVAVGGLTVAVAVPGVGLGLLAGAYVDRHDRRRIMITADVCRGALLGLLAVAVLSPAGPAVLLVIVFLQAAVGAFFEPARAGLMQTVVPATEQVRANSLVQTTTVIGELTGTTLAGVLVAAVHLYWISFAVDAATFALSAVLIATIPVDPTVPAGGHQPVRAAIADGLRAVRSSPVLRALLLVFSALTFALGPMAVLLAPYVVDTLHISTGWIGVIQGGDTVGNIAGGVLVALAARRVRPPVLVVAGMFALAAVVAGLAAATTVVALTLAHVVFGFLTVSVQTGIGALTQTEVDNRLMGRFVGLMSIVPGVVSVLAMTFAGALGGVVGVRTVFVVSGAVLAVSSIVAWYLLHRATRSGPLASGDAVAG